MDDHLTLLLSIKPEFTEMILNGTKRFELRRLRPKATVGMSGLIYSSQPTCALLGTFKVAEVIQLPLENLWRLVGSESGVSRKLFDRYFYGKRMGVAIAIADARRIANPICLNKLRENWNGFHPPQSFRYLSKVERRALMQKHNGFPDLVTQRRKSA